jgi:hypothetical protein
MCDILEPHRLESAILAARGELFSPYDGLRYVEPIA